MARTSRGRKHLYPLQGGPWLVERLFWVFAGITLGGVALTLGTGFVCGVLWKEARNAFSLFLMVVGAMIAVGVPAIGLVGWVTGRATQICPDCLGGMARGAYVCPHCGFRETPRQERS